MSRAVGAGGGDARYGRVRPVLLPALLGAVVLAATFPLAGGEWFTAVRFAVTILALIVLVMTVQHRRIGWGLALVPVAVVWNPVLPLELDPAVWAPVHLAGAVLFVVVGAVVRVPAAPPPGAPGGAGRR